MSGWLSTHVLDTANGIPAAGIKLSLWQMETPALKIRSKQTQSEQTQSKGESHRPGFQYLKAVTTNADGRTDTPLLEGEDFQCGCYEIIFSVGDYFARHSLTKQEDSLPKDYPFLDIVPLCFGIADINAHYHVPLLVSPWSYSTYRGS
ncbi:MAG: hydroxyisourate hydrolase [Cyanobacteria bacterium P01_D01_bin.105]